MPEEDHSPIELLQRLLIEGELVIEIYSCDEDRVKKALIGAKSRLNQKMLKEGLEPDNSSLSFSTISETEGIEDSKTGETSLSTKKLLISLQRKGTIKVISVESVDDEL